MYRTIFPRDLFAEFDRLQREFSGLLDGTPSIRGLGRGGYPALNVGTSPTSIEDTSPGVRQVTSTSSSGIRTVTG